MTIQRKTRLGRIFYETLLKACGGSTSFKR